MHRLYKGTAVALCVEAREQCIWARPQQTCREDWDQKKFQLTQRWHEVLSV